MSDPRTPFFVNWLPMEAATRRFALRVGVVAVLLAGGIGAALAMTQSQPETPIEPRRQGALVGLLRATPHPHLVHKDESGTIRTIAFTGGGKHGIDPPDRGQRLTRVEGTVFQRGASRLMAAPSFGDAEEDASLLAELAAFRDEALGEMRLEGEIVDSKCFFGAMSPGRGATHRACAQMCIKGGIPPYLISETADGREVHAMLAGVDGQPIGEAVLPFVAEPVAITGQLVRRGDLLIMKIDPKAILRL